MPNDIAQDVCKSVRALGLSAERTRRIVDGVSNDISNNGPEWLASRIKGLQAYYAGTGEFPGWVRKKTIKKTGLLKPRGWMSNLIGSLSKQETTLVVLSTIRGAIVLDNPTHKQLEKWNSAVTKPPTPSKLLMPPVYNIDKLESDLKRRISKLKAFGPDDIHGTRYPKGISYGSIRRGKALDMCGLYHAWKDSILFAPSSAWTFQDQSGVRIPGISVAKARPILNQMRKLAPDAKRKPYGKRTGKPSKRLEEYPVGHISFLQQPFGKLRTVANPNRFVQWQLTPLGEVLSDWINHQPGIYNLCQEEGMRWIQDCLKSKIHLTSADLSSASDTLDFIQVSSVLKNAGPEMKRHLDYFEQVSKMPWYVTSKQARDYIGQETIRWKQGQPLGLRPSFPILTITNWIAARTAVIAVDGKEDHDNPPFAIVGDDIVIHTKYAAEYQKAISQLGGIANVDKACASDKQAEFCSRLISDDKIIRLKARYIPDNLPQNILTYQGILPTMRCPLWIKRKASRIGSFALEESGLVPAYHPQQPKSLKVKVLAQAVLSLDKGKDTPTEKSFQSMWWAASEADPHGIMPQPRKAKAKQTSIKLMDAPLKERVRKFEEWNPDISIWELPVMLGLTKKKSHNRFCSLEDIEKSLSTLYEEPRTMSEFPNIKWVRKTHPASLVALEESSAREQRVSTVRSRFEHKSMSYEPDVNPIRSLEQLNKKLESIDNSVINSSEVGLIRSISPDVDELIELKGSDVEITSYSKNQTTSTVKVPLDEIIIKPKVSRPKALNDKLQELISRLDANMDETTDEQTFEL